jgi:LysR family glycine cleavage system transcriptional activator
MARRLPPLNALRAFEAAARHLSFLKAAEELHVTPGAVSQQIKALEDLLGVTLFRRLPRGVLLSDAGQRYGKRLGELLDGVEAATAALKRDSASAVLTVSTTTSLAARWLIPRLGSFSAAHPGIVVRVSAENALVDFATAEADIALRRTKAAFPGLRSERLLPEEVFPVCSPALAAGPPPLRTLEDLRHLTMLHEDIIPGGIELDWSDWLTALSARHIEVREGPRFTYSHMSLQAAAAGLGVALGNNVLAGGDLASGLLVRPFVESVPSPFSYWLVCPEATAERPKLRAFRDWIMAEARHFLEEQAKLAVEPPGAGAD